MFSVSYFTEGYFNNYFKSSSEVVVLNIEEDGGGNSKRHRELMAFTLDRDDRDILEFIISFVLGRRL